MRVVWPVLLLSLLSGCGSSPPSGAHSLTPAWVAPLASMDDPHFRNGTVFVRAIHAGHPEESPHLYAVDAEKGTELWASQLVTPPDGPPVLVSRDGQVALAGDDGYHVLDGKTGKELALTPDEPLLDAQSGAMVVPPKLAHACGGAAVRQGVYCAVDEKRRLGAWKEGKRLWTFDPKLSKDATWVRLGWAGDVLLLFDNGQLQGVREGKQLWKTALGDQQDMQLGSGRMFGKVFVAQAQGMMVKAGVSSLATQLFGIDPETGKLLWHYGPYGAVLETDHPEQLWVTQNQLNTNVGDTAALTAQIDPVTGQEQVHRPWTTYGQVIGDLAWGSYSASWPDTATEYTGDRRGSKMMAPLQPGPLYKSSLKVVAFVKNKPVAESPRWDATRISSMPAVGGGKVFVATLAEMKEGKSGLWAFSVQQGQ